MAEYKTGTGPSRRAASSRWWPASARARSVPGDGEPRFFRGVVYGLILSCAFVAAVVTAILVWIR